jgi:hypothetical protein
MAKMQQSARFRSMTAIVGSLLLAVCFLWLGWIFFSQHSGKPLASSIVLPGLATTPTVNQQFALLLAQGITLSSTDQKPGLSQQQAVAIADQLEADAASNAKSISAHYGLLTYPMIKTPVTHPDWNNVEVWMIWYRQIPQGSNDTSVDPAPSSRPYHDLYVFLDANSGKELFSLWV